MKKDECTDANSAYGIFHYGKKYQDEHDKFMQKVIENLNNPEQVDLLFEAKEKATENLLKLLKKAKKKDKKITKKKVIKIMKIVWGCPR